MLRVTQSESMNAAKKYFSESLRRGDYYLEGQEIAGGWSGKGAQLLGLSGEVQREEFEALLENKRPDGTQLTVRNNKDRRPGYDFTFDVPKSVSLAYAIGGDKRILGATRTAVMRTMQSIEEEMHARVRKGGAFNDRKTGNMVYADFTHLTTRPTVIKKEDEAATLEVNPWLEGFRDKSGAINAPDPHVHIHVYAMNATYDEVENIWKAGEFMRIKRDANYHQAVYHCHLAGELQKLGYEVDQTANAFEVYGVSRDAIKTSSRRTQEIENLAVELGISDPDAKAQLGSKSRKRKNPNLDMNQLREIWKPMIGKRDSEQIKCIADESQATKFPRARDNEAAAKTAIKNALCHELERASVVEERRLLTGALKRAVGNATVDTVTKEDESSGKLIRGKQDEQTLVTTLEVLKEEAALLSIIREGRGSVAALNPDGHVIRNPLLSGDSKGAKEQRAAIDLVLKSNDWVVGISGRAGTGKTTLMKEAEFGVLDSGRTLFVCAPTAEAAYGVLQSEGFRDAQTVKGLLRNKDFHRKLSGSILWVDEAGMLSNRDMLEVLELAKETRVAKVVLAGDSTQIRSVIRGDAFRYLEEEAGLAVARLDEVKRQRNPALKAAVESISRGDIQGGFGQLERSGAIREDDIAQARKRLAEGYANTITGRNNGGVSQSALVVAATHKECEQVTEAIREQLKDAGRIDTVERKVARTVNLKWTQEQRGDAANYEPDLVVQFKQNSEGFKRSERVRVVDTNARNGNVWIRTNGGRTMTLSLADSEHFQVYKLVDLSVSVGDKLRVSENVQIGDKRLNNGSIVEVEKFHENGDIETTKGVRLPKDFGHLTHGYVVTADSAQSKTVDHVYASISSESMHVADRRRFYVMASRARYDFQVYTDNKEALMHWVQRDSVRSFATEVIGKETSKRLLRQSQRREHERALEKQRQRQREIERHREREGARRSRRPQRTLEIEMR